jgi:hypothetical protein
MFIADGEGDSDDMDNQQLIDDGLFEEEDIDSQEEEEEIIQDRINDRIAARMMDIVNAQPGEAQHGYRAPHRRVDGRANQDWSQEEAEV